MQQACALWFIAWIIYTEIQSPHAQTILQHLIHVQKNGLAVAATLRGLFAHNGSIGDTILKEATGLDYTFYRETPISTVEEIITMLENA